MTKKHKVEPVPSGAFSLCSSKDIVLEAFLGTCVGVVIIDKVAKVAGLYHILLPEPNLLSVPEDPFIYASTGLPRFIKKMEEAGATIQNMEAVVAGGALIGPVSWDDLELNIGGQTSEVVLHILNSHNIHIVHSELGGYFACKLMVSVKSLAWTISPIFDTVDDDINPGLFVNRGEIDVAIARVRPIPQLAIKIINMMRSDDYEMKDIAKIVQQDQVIAAKVINFSNSAIFSPKKEITSIQQALFMLGEKKLLNLVITTSTETFFQQSQQGYSLCLGGLYQHSLTVAWVAENLARYVGGIPEDIAYTAGLLHDIGKVVLDQFLASRSPFFYREIYDQDETLIGVEQRVLQTDHQKVGYRLAELWKLPGQIQQSIAYHHMPERADVPDKLIYVIYFADLLVSRFQVGKEIDRLNTEQFDQRLHTVGLKKNQFSELIETIPWIAIEKSLQIL